MSILFQHNAPGITIAEIESRASVSKRETGTHKATFLANTVLSPDWFALNWMTTWWINPINNR